jgi:hypothetical protein
MNNRIRKMNFEGASEDAKFVNLRLTQEFSFIESIIDRVITDNKLKYLALTRLEESFLWVIKAVSENAIDKNKIL